MCERNKTATVTIGKKQSIVTLKTIDSCIAHLVQILNDAGYETVASCCGHNIRPGNIALRDGRELVIVPDFKTGREVDKMFKPLA